jgi:hypothetical protein
MVGVKIITGKKNPRRRRVIQNLGIFSKIKTYAK